MEGTTIILVLISWFSPYPTDNLKENNKEKRNLKYKRWDATLLFQICLSNMRVISGKNDNRQNIQNIAPTSNSTASNAIFKTGLIGIKPVIIIAINVPTAIIWHLNDHVCNMSLNGESSPIVSATVSNDMEIAKSAMINANAPPTTTFMFTIVSAHSILPPVEPSRIILVEDYLNHQRIQKFALKESVNSQIRWGRIAVGGNLAILPFYYFFFTLFLKHHPHSFHPQNEISLIQKRANNLLLTSHRKRVSGLSPIKFVSCINFDENAILSANVTFSSVKHDIKYHLINITVFYQNSRYCFKVIFGSVNYFSDNTCLPFTVSEKKITHTGQTTKQKSCGYGPNQSRTHIEIRVLCGMI